MQLGSGSDEIDQPVGQEQLMKTKIGIFNCNTILEIFENDDNTVVL